MADDRLRNAGAADRRRSGGALTITALTVLAALAGLVLWLALSAEDTMTRMRVAVDRESLRVELALAPPPAPVPPEPAAAEVEVETPAEPAPVATTVPTEQAQPDPAPSAAPAPSDDDLADGEPPGTEPPASEPPVAELPAAGAPALAASETAAPPPPPPPPAAEPAVTVPEEDAQVALLPAPDPALVEPTPDGPLPRVAPDGRQPWRAYARPFDISDPRPRIAIVITDLGQSGAATETAIQGLPGAVSLAFAPYSGALDRWLPEARAAGHETLLMVPMEPTSYPRNDPGPQTLLTSLTPEANAQRLEWVLRRGSGYVGVVNAMGSRLTAAPEALRPVFEALDTRGLMFLDSRTAADSVATRVGESVGLPVAVNDRFIDDVAARDAIDLRLQELEDLARERGYAVGLAYPYPVSFERLAAWIPTLEEKGIVLAPVSAIAAARQESL